jgi:phosphonatase-like hydrolase
MDLDLFLFDIAGTVIRDDGLVLGVYRRLMAEEDLDADEAWIQAHMGRDKHLVFAELLELNGRDDASAAALAARFAVAIEESVARSAPDVLAGAVEAMTALRGAGVRVGFTTGFARSTAELILSQRGWLADVLVASDEVAHGRPAPDLIYEAMRRAGVGDPARVGVCGDTPSDLEAGHEAGCAMIVGVGHGTHTLDELAAYKHTHLFEDLTGLARLVTVEA